MGAQHILSPRIGVAALSSPLEVGAQRAPKAALDMARVLTASGCDVVNLGSINAPAIAVAAGKRAAAESLDALAFVATSWFEDYLALDFLEECSLPLLLWSLPGMETGALCGTQQLTAYLRQLGSPFECVFGDADDPEGRRRAGVYLRAAALRSRLRRARIGMMGAHVNGMTHTAANEIALKKAVGPRLVWIDMPRLLKHAESGSEEEAAQLWNTLRAKANPCAVSDKDGVDSMRLYAAIRREIVDNGLCAATVGCYPQLMGRVCLAASLLADEGIPLACEGDAHGAVGQYMLQLLTGQPTHNTDWLDPADAHSVVFTHCGSGSLTLAENSGDIRISSVRLMRQGACALFTAKPGPVTLVNITPHAEGYQCGVLEGEAVHTEMVFPGNPVRVRFTQPVRTLIDWVHRAGLGHHWMIGYGHVAGEIRSWASMVGRGLTISEPS